MARKSTSRRYFGSIRKLASGRYQARYTGPDGRTYTARSAGGAPTFDTVKDADAALASVRAAIVANTWASPDAPRKRPERPQPFAEYASTWLAERDLAVRTRELYEQLLRTRILPTFGEVALGDITPGAVRTWYAAQGAAHKTGRAHAYSLLRTVLATAAADDLIPANPCRIRGAGAVKRDEKQRKIRPATLDELAAIVEALPARYRLAALLSAWCALRFGELAELRRSDVELSKPGEPDRGRLRISRAVVQTREAGRLVKGPKSSAGRRNVAIPPHLVPLVREHLGSHVTGRDGLLFPSATDPSAHLAPSTLHRVFRPAREAAGRPDLRWHDLRHTGAVLAAATGATLAELMARLGHSTSAAAMVYQHAAEDRDQVIAELMSQRMATASPQN